MQPPPLNDPRYQLSYGWQSPPAQQSSSGKLQPPKKKPDISAYVGIGVIVFILVGLIVAYGVTHPFGTSTPSESQTLTFSGNDNHQTDYFTVPDNWTLDYTCSGFPDGVTGAMYVFVYDSPNDVLAAPVNASCAVGGTSGSTEEHQGGSIYLGVNATGQWSITIHTHP